MLMQLNKYLISVFRLCANCKCITCTRK